MQWLRKILLICYAPSLHFPLATFSIHGYVRRSIKLKPSSENNALDVSANLQSNQVKADVSMHSTIATTSETSISLSHDKDDEYEKLFRRMNPPSVAVDNESCENATVIELCRSRLFSIVMHTVMHLDTQSTTITAYSLPTELQPKGYNPSTLSYSRNMEDEYQKFIRRMNPPRVVIDNESCKNATIIQVDSAHEHGILLEVVQVLTDINFIVTKVYISSDGGWFMDVFNVTDPEGNKITDEEILGYIQKARFC